MKYFKYLILVLAVAQLGCKKDSELTKQKCDAYAILDSDLYDNGPDDSKTIKSIVLDKKCLTVVYWGGCDDYEMKLVGKRSPALPAGFDIVDLRLSFDDNSTCERLNSNTVIFDLTPLELGTSGTILLKIDEWEKDIAYVY